MSRPVRIYVADPGAANMIADVPAALAGFGLDVGVHAIGSGAAQLDRLGVAHRPWDPQTPELSSDSAAIVLGGGDKAAPFMPDLIARARAQNLPSIGLVDSPANPAHRFGVSEAPFAERLPDLILVGDQRTRTAFVATGIQPDRLPVVGLAHLDRVRRMRQAFTAQEQRILRARLLPAIDPDRVIVVFLAEGRDPVDDRVSWRREGYTLFGFGRSNFRTAIVIEEVAASLGLQAPKPALVVRPHPKNERRDFDAVTRLVDAFYDGAELYALLQIADAVIGMTSITLVEAAILGRPTLSIIPHPEETFWLSALDSGLIQVACTRGEIAAAVPRLISGHLQLEDVDSIYLPNAATRTAALIAGATKMRRRVAVVP